MHLFAYGTLMAPEIMTLVTGVNCRSRKATLPGYVRKKIRGEVYPAITLQADGCVEGLIYYNLSSEAFDRLDRFEGPQYVRTRVFIACDDGTSEQALTYVIAVNFAHRLSSEEWNYEIFKQRNKFFPGR